LRILIVNFVFFALLFSYQVGGSLLSDVSLSFNTEYNVHIVEEYRFNVNKLGTEGHFIFIRKEYRKVN